MPAAVERVSCSYPAEPQPRGSQTWDWQEKQRRLVWKFKKVPGGTEHTLQVRCPPPEANLVLSTSYGVTEQTAVQCLVTASGLWCT
jgi:hypothetical protein